MTNPFGLNILGLSLDDSAALTKWVTDARPAACVVMDETKIAQNVRAASPETLVIFRHSKDENKWFNSHNLQDPTPDQWLTSHSSLAVNGVILQVFNENEPGSDVVGEYVGWLTKLIALANAQNFTLALPAFAVTHPTADRVNGGVYDDLLRALNGSRHYLLVHEYFKKQPFAAGESDWVGHFQVWIDHAKVLGIPAPRIIVGEHGRDEGGDPINDGWSKQNWSQEEYFNRLVMAQPLYQKHNIPVCIFCYGSAWPSFDIQRAKDLKDRLIQYGTDHPMGTAPVSDGDTTAPVAVDRKTLGKPIAGTIAAVKATFTNIRDVPSTSGNRLGKLFVGDAITYRPQPTVKIGNYHWYALEKPVVGWFADVATPTPNP